MNYQNKCPTISSVYCRVLRPTVSRQTFQGFDARVAAQTQKLTDNNVALARMNNRLLAQLDRLRQDHAHLEHLAAGQYAVSRAKEAELAAEVKGLKAIVKDSLAERENLRAQLAAKQVSWKIVTISLQCAPPSFFPF